LSYLAMRDEYQVNKFYIPEGSVEIHCDELPNLLEMDEIVASGTNKPFNLGKGEVNDV